jgi:GNAT superfamily N-acetyltransferase
VPTVPTMDGAMILRQLDAERQTVADGDGTLEKTPHVVRAFGMGGSWSAIVYSRFLPSETDDRINAEIEYFTQLKRDFEWKVYSHDEPPDLLMRLRDRGFRIGEEESLMICDPKKLSPAVMAPPNAGVTVNPVRDEERMEDFLAVESVVWPGEPGKRRELRFAILNDPLERDVAFVGYCDRKPVGCGRVTVSLYSQFAGLWGGSVLPDFRGRGVYRALLSARIQHLRQFDSIRYLRVDALPTSRPILEKYGFERIASTWPAEWPPER